MKEPISYLVTFPNGDEMYACRACANLVFKHDAGAFGFISVEKHDCELFYEGTCEDRPPRIPNQPATFGIEEMELSVYTYNVLKRAGVDTIGQLAKFTVHDLAAWYQSDLSASRVEHPISGRKLLDLQKAQNDAIELCSRTQWTGNPL